MKTNLFRNTGRALGGLAVIGAAFSVGYLVKQAETNMTGTVFEITIPDLPLCDATHQTNCAASKIDWNALRARLSQPAQ